MHNMVFLFLCELVSYVFTFFKKRVFTFLETFVNTDSHAAYQHT